MTVPVRIVAAFGLAFFLSCLGFAVPAVHWLFYLPGILLRRLMILLALAIPIGSWEALALEFSFNVLVWLAVMFLALTALAPRR